VRNLHVAVREWPAGDGHAEIVFLHRILPGRTDQSYGLHVARLAGMPMAVVTRGREVLASLAVHHAVPLAPGADGLGAVGIAASVRPDVRNVPQLKPVERGAQMSLFTEYVSHPALDVLRETKLDLLSPMQAFDALRRLKELADA
jgi:DNA mismatch repair protein MutS